MPNAEVCKVLVNSSGKSILWLPKGSKLPKGPLEIICNERPMKAWIVAIAINVLTEGSGKGKNLMDQTLKGWFGPEAGMAGRRDQVQFSKVGKQWVMEPIL